MTALRRRGARARGSPRGWVIAAVVLALAGTLLAAGCNPGRPSRANPPPAPPPATTPPAEPPAAPPPEPEGEPSPLSGLRFPAERLQRRPVMVVFDNHPNARPQTGLAEAEIVYEILVEGGITRMLALYLGPEVPVLGPVRSIRHYFLDLALGYDAILVYVGQSPRAGQEIQGLQVPGLNDFTHGAAFWRSTARPRPHNLYTSTELIRTVAGQVGIDSATGPTEGPFRFRAAAEPDGTGETPAGAPAGRVTVAYPGFLGYQVTWSYDPERGAYTRTIGDATHVDGATQQPLAFKALILQELRATPIPGDEAGRLDMNWVGSGSLRILENGTVREGRWEKTTRRAMPRYLEADGMPVTLDPGRIWIMVVPPEAKVTIE